MARDDRLMLFTCLDEHYGIDLRWTHEIIYRPQLLTLPGLTPPVCGLIIWQGRTLPVIGMRQLAGEQRMPDRPAVVILGDDGQRAGLLVDGIGETVSVPGQDLFPLGRTLSVGRPYLSQAFRLKNGLVFALNVPALLERFCSPPRRAGA
ncbi:MAG: chemotaxis protein CheW [Candidatus Edwardsbacteria bacterium]|nr:chemotaxis protein CheW [Candidatus Edwardsbacteria bacterium]